MTAALVVVLLGDTSTRNSTAFAQNAIVESIWTHVLKWEPNPAPIEGGQATARVIALARDGDVMMFEGYVNTMNPAGPFTISEGDPIAGFAGRWQTCQEGIKIAYIKNYLWPSNLKQFVEPILTTQHTGIIKMRGRELTFQGQRFTTGHSPSRENLERIVPLSKKLWSDRPDIRARIEALVTC